MRGVRWVGFLAAACALLLTGCAGSVVDGRGTAAAPSRTAPSKFPTSSASSSAGIGSAQFPRTPEQQSNFGDPAKADICATIGSAAIAKLVPGWTAATSQYQYPPGCSWLLTKGANRFYFDVYGGQVAPPTSGTPTTRTVAGLGVKSYPYEPSSRDCQRVLDDGFVQFLTETFSSAATAMVAPFACRVADTITNLLAQHISAHSVARLSVASPSLTQIDFCATLAHAQLAKLPLFVGSTQSDNFFGIECEQHSPQFDMSISFALARAGVQVGMTSQTVGGHAIFAESDNSTSSCIFRSFQGRTATGQIEVLDLDMSADDTTHPPADLCSSAQQALAGFLDAAHLR